MTRTTRRTSKRYLKMRTMLPTFWTRGSACMHPTMGCTTSIQRTLKLKSTSSPSKWQVIKKKLIKILFGFVCDCPPVNTMKAYIVYIYMIWCNFDSFNLNVFLLRAWILFFYHFHVFRTFGFIIEEQCGEDDSQQAAEAMVQLSGVGYYAQQQQGSYFTHPNTLDPYSKPLSPLHLLICIYNI